MNKIFLLAISFLLYSATINAQLSAIVTVNAASCNGNNGSATVTASGGSGYTYKWSTGATTATATGLAAGAYTVTVYGNTGGGAIVNNIYTQDFQGTSNWTLNISTGSNGTDHNIWAINDTCGGAAVGTCAGTRNGDKTLHVHATLWYPPYSYDGALYNAGGFGAIQTDLAAQSPPINTTGGQHMVLSYDFIGNGEGSSDVGSCYYSTDGGSTFTLLDGSLKSGQCSDHGKWTHRAYSLPPQCNNLTNFIIRFRWVNNNNDAGSDPAVGINNIILGDSVGSTATASDSVIVPVTITQQSVQAGFTVYKVANPGIYYARNTSTGAGPLHYHWAFGDNTSYDGCCPLYAFWTAGYWSVCLTATDSHGCSDTYCDSSFYNAFKMEGDMMTEFIVDSAGVATGIEDISATTSVEIFPNPATNTLNITPHNFQPLKIAIYNMDGRMVSDEKYNPVVDITGLPAGIYFMEVKDNTSTIRSRFFKM